MADDCKEATVMIVDDVPANLTLLSAILRKDNYQVAVFTSGIAALEAAYQNPPDIILLDISMPEMDGYQVCQALKSNGQLSPIPVIFISALSQVHEKVKGFEVGGQDYITKPFEIREVRERVKTHLNLAWTRRELEETLDQTLTGSIELITDFMGFVNPNAFSRGIRIKQNMAAMVEQLHLSPKRWFELAAVLSQFGPAALPPALQEKYSLRKRLSTGEKEDIDHSIELMTSMLKNIPRLGPVAEMIAHYKLTSKLVGGNSFYELDITEQGGMMLNLLQQYDQLLLESKRSEEIIEVLRKERNFPEALLQSLQSIDKASGDLETRCCPLSGLVHGMVLDEDVLDNDGRILLKRGVKFTPTIIEALKFQTPKLVKQMIMVKIIPTLNKDRCSLWDGREKRRKRR